MATDLMPDEAYEALRALQVEGQDADVSSTMIQVLNDRGYVEILDGIPVVTEAGASALRAKESGVPTLFVKPPSD